MSDEEFLYSEDHVNALRDKILELEQENEVLKARIGILQQRVWEYETFYTYDT